jgi:hypothetical protein
MKSAIFGGMWCGAFAAVYLMAGGEASWGWPTWVIIVAGCFMGRATADIVEWRKKKRAT